jgi:tripartite-type tricarboxylate transporter receptor subunit TctC
VIAMRVDRRIVLLLPVLAFGMPAGPAQAQVRWPAAKPITIVVPFPPGPALDLVARLVAEKIGPALGQTIVIDNRSGANGTIGSNLVARAAPDGYTLLAATAGTHVTAVHLTKNLPYDPVKDFTPLAAAVEPVTCLAVHRSVPVNSVAELIAYAKARPDELSYGSSGVGSVFHMMGELFNQTAGVRIKHVPYRGVAPAMQDVAGGHIPMVFISVSNAMPAMQDGRVKILAILEPTRYAKLPDVPSISESIPAFQKPSSWFGFFGPAEMPGEIVTRLNAEIVKALSAPDVVAKLQDNGMTVIGGSAEEFGARMRDGIARYGEIIKAAGIKPE